MSENVTVNNCKAWFWSKSWCRQKLQVLQLHTSGGPYRWPNMKMVLLSVLLSKPLLPRPTPLPKAAFLLPLRCRPKTESGEGHPSTFKLNFRPPQKKLALATQRDWQHSEVIHTGPWVPDWPLPSCVILGKSLTILESWASCCHHWAQELVGRLKEIVQVLITATTGHCTSPSGLKQVCHLVSGVSPGETPKAVN